MGADPAGTEFATLSGGARTISSDFEWQHVNLRRYFSYLEHLIDRGTQRSVFEPNSERLWSERAVHDRRLPAHRAAERRAFRRKARERVLRQGNDSTMI
jgi:hypothetical protein